jgi:hypothetical protein
MTPLRDGGARVATVRLIGAAASLDPAGRALLDLSMHRGLSDAEIAQLAGLSLAAVTNRKLDVVEHLSSELGLPPYEIVAALGTISRSRQPREPVPAAPEIRYEASVEPGDPIVLPPLPRLRLRRGEWVLRALNPAAMTGGRATQS